MQQIYYHIPATGWSRLTNRDEVPSNVIDGARQLLAARKGRLGPFRVDVRRLPGAAVYDVRCETRLMTTCGLALDDTASQQYGESWPNFLGSRPGRRQPAAITLVVRGSLSFVFRRRRPGGNDVATHTTGHRLECRLTNGSRRKLELSRPCNDEVQ